MANTLKFGNGEWYGKKDTILAYNDENSNYKPLPFDFSRASKATVINKDGLIEEVGSGQPRIDYKDDSEGALLLEPQRTNLITYSSDFSDASWSKTGASATSGFTSPDGTTNAFKLVEGTNNGIHQLNAIGISTVVDRYNFSVFVKPNGRNEIRIVGTNYFSSGTDAYFNLETKVITYGARAENGLIETLANGWFRCSFSSSGGEFVGNNAHMNIETALNNSNSYQGDGTSGVYIYGAMVEQGSYATSYIPTQGSAVTRLAESCSNGANDQVINSTEGVLYYEASYIDGSDYNSVSLSNNSGSEKLRTWYDNTNLVFANFVNNVNQTFIAYPISKNINYKIAVRYKLNDFALYVNGNKATNIVVNLGGVSPQNSYNKLNLNSGDIYNKLYGNVKDVKLYNTALTDSELAALTQV